MAATDVTRAGEARGNINSASHDTPSFGDRARRLMTETKAATKTTEFFMVVAAVLGILVSALVIKGGDTGGTDEFIARQAWLYVAIVVGAYADRARLGEVRQPGAVHRRRQPRQPLLVRACSAGCAPARAQPRCLPVLVLVAGRHSGARWTVRPPTGADR